MNAYRYSGDSMSDPATYRTKEEVNAWKERDAVKSFGAELVKKGVLTEQKIEEIDEQKNEEVNDIFKRAKECPMTDVCELETDIVI